MGRGGGLWMMISPSARAPEHRLKRHANSAKSFAFMLPLCRIRRHRVSACCAEIVRKMFRGGCGGLVLRSPSMRSLSGSLCVRGARNRTPEMTEEEKKERKQKQGEEERRRELVR